MKASAHLGERAAVQVLALADAVAEVEIPVGGDFRGGGEVRSPVHLDEALALHEGAGEDLVPPLRRSSLSLPS